MTLKLNRPWLTQAEMIEMCKKDLPDFESEFERLINDPETVRDEDEDGMTTAQLLQVMKDYDLEFTDIFRAYYGQIGDYDVTDFVEVTRTAQPTDVVLNWRKPK